MISMGESSSTKYTVQCGEEHAPCRSNSFEVRCAWKQTSWHSAPLPVQLGIERVMQVPSMREHDWSRDDGIDTFFFHAPMSHLKVGLGAAEGLPTWPSMDPGTGAIF